MISYIILIFLMIICFWGAFGWYVKEWWSERKARKEFEKRQERYRRMV